MNKVAAGKRYETRIKKYLESIGFKVEKARAAVKFIGPGRCFSSQQDFFSCADLIGIHHKKPYTLFIQAHHGDSIGPRKLKLEAVEWNHTIHNIQLWTPAKGIQSGARVLVLMPGNVWQEHIFRIKDGIEPINNIL